MIERVRKIKKKEGNRFNGYGKNDCCKKSTKWWLTVATGGALAVGLLGGYGLATAIHGTNNQQSAIQQTATIPGAPEQGQNGQNGGPDNGMPPQDGGPGQNGQDQEMPPQDSQQSDNDKSKNSSAQKNDNGKKNKKKSSTDTNEQSDKNNKSTKENKTSQS